MNTKRITKSALGKMTIMKVIEMIVDNTNQAKEILPKAALPYVKELSSRLGITEIQAVILSVFVDSCFDSYVSMNDVAKHFGVRPTSIIDVADVFSELMALNIIVRERGRHNEYGYRIPQHVIDEIRKGHIPEKEKLDGLTAYEFIDTVFDWLNKREQNDLSDTELDERIGLIMESNKHLSLVCQLRFYNLCPEDIRLFFVFAKNFIEEKDDGQMSHDIRDYFEYRSLRHHCRMLERGEHDLMHVKLVEFSCRDGVADPCSWKLTNYAKDEVLVELNLKQKNKIKLDMTKYTDIAKKDLYYNEKVTKQVDKLESLLEPDNMAKVMERLEAKGLRKGFTCIFHGGPGTGKTETALQLALRTQRDIMMVDVPGIRSKWVGETEQNVKALFERYRKAVKNAEDGKMPILFFNEADALLNRRNEGGTNAVDKMENAMQNIILQEMENLEGIMIATTNLTGNLDSAFERRFLFKIEFDKPSPDERKHIWKAMLPDLSDCQAMKLAEKFDFSGGQIENIARKRIIGDILDSRDVLDLTSIIDDCQQELLSKSNSKIGFC